MEEQQTMDVEQAAALASLESVAGEGEQIAVQAEGEQQAAAVMDSTQEARAIICTISPLVGNFWPWLEPVLTEENKEQLAVAWGPVMEYYGVTLGGVMSHPLAGAALVTIPMVAQGFQEYKKQLPKAQEKTIPEATPEFLERG